MKAISFKHFSGRNIYCHKQCIRMDVDLEGFKDIPSKNIKGFNENLIKLMPILKEHRCGIDEEGGFVKRLEEGTYLAHICEHIIIALQNMIGIEVAYGKAREIKGDVYYIVYECKYKYTAMKVANIAISLINSLIRGNKFNIKNALLEIKNTFNEEKLGPSTLAILKEAKKRGIPILRFGKESIFQLGYGSTSKMIEATIGNDTRCLSVDIAGDKYLTKQMLLNQCIPVAYGEVIKGFMHMLLTAKDIGYPVVIKPRYGNQGKGVFVNLKNEEELIRAYKSICEKYDDILIEKYIQGEDFRICMVDYKVVAVSKRISPRVIGNGKDNILKLINDINLDKNRGDGHEKPLTKIKVNDELVNYIRKNSYELSYVPKKGESVILRENANLSTGGTAIDYTDLICDENKKLCERVAKTIGLDICGIDVCCSDISKPIDGVIIEVNAAPGIRMHEFPNEGKKRSVSSAIVDMMFKDVNKQIPLVSVTGTNGKTTTTRLISYVLSKAGYSTGMTTTGGIYIDNHCISKGDTTGYNSAMTVLTNKNVEAAVLETARGGMIKKGLAYDLADVAVITNITGDHLGVDGIETLQDLAFVKSLVGEAVKKDGYVVLNADDSMTIEIIHRMKANIILFSKNKENCLLKEHIKKGCYGVYVDNDIIYVQKGENIDSLINIKDIGITLNGALKYNIENAMAACAALIKLNIDYKYIIQGLKDFSLNDKDNPGRFNLYNLNGINVVLDYGHNIDGYNKVMEGIKNLNYTRLVGVVGMPGDRRDEDIVSVGTICGKNFDYLYVKEDRDKRGRKNGEVANLLIKGMCKSNFNKENINIVLDEKQALKKAIKCAKKGDLIVAFFEEYEPLLDVISEELNLINKNKVNSHKALA